MHRSSRNPTARRRRRRRTAVVAAAAVLVLLGGTALWGVGRYGPRFGVYLVPRSPARYADVALDLIAGGYSADGPAWDAARASARSAAEDATGYADLHAVLAEAVGVAGGPHASLLTPEEAVASERAAQEAPGPRVTTTGDVTTVTVPEIVDVSTTVQQRYADTLAAGISAAARATTAFRGLPDVTSFGAPSAGYTSANTPDRLADGAVLVVTESVDVDRTGEVLDEQPVPADHPTTGEQARPAADAWLASRGCPAP